MREQKKWKVGMRAALVLSLLLFGGCVEKELEFDLTELPRARNGMTWPYGGLFEIYYYSEENCFREGDVSFQCRRESIELVPLIESVSSRINKIGEGYHHKPGGRYPNVAFFLPRSFPAVKFAEVCVGLQNETKLPVNFKLAILGDFEEVDSFKNNPRELNPSAFYLGRIVKELKDVESEGDVDVLKLVIRESDFIINDWTPNENANLRSIEEVQDRMKTFLMSASLTDETPVLQIQILKGVSLQRLVSTLDLNELHNVRIIFNLP